MSGSGELEDGGDAAEPMVEEDHGSLTASHAAMTEVSADMLDCVYGVACRLAWCLCYACRCMFAYTCAFEEPMHKHV